MLTGPLPTRLDHRKMASRGQVLKGTIPVDRFVRFSELLTEVDGDIDLDLAFSRGQQGKTNICGSARATVALICQSCLQPFRYELDCKISLNVVASDSEIAELEDNSSVVVCEDSEISLADFLEDELIMSVPMIPRHVEAQCPDNEYRQVDAEAPIEDNTTTHRPFADLAAAIKRQDTKES